PRTFFCALAGVFVVVKHRTNIRRLLHGQENKIGWGAPIRKLLHVLALGLWFGSAVFFTFVVAPSLFATFAELGSKEERPTWFPLPRDYVGSGGDVEGPREQGGRVFGYAVGPLFHWYFLFSGLCGFIAAWTARTWSRENPGIRAHWWRATLLLVALISVL